VKESEAEKGFSPQFTDFTFRTFFFIVKRSMLNNKFL